MQLDLEKDTGAFDFQDPERSEDFLEQPSVVIDVDF